MSQTARNRTAPREGRTPPPSFGAAIPPATPQGGPTSEQAEAVREWLRWHLPELVGLTAPLALSLLISAWCLVLAGGVAVLWGSRETRQARQRAQLRAANRAALTTPTTTAADAEETTR